MSSSRFAAPVLLVGLFLAAAPGLKAAPGKLTSTGPFEVSGYSQQLLYPGSDPRRILVRTHEDLFETRDGGVNWRSVLPHALAIGPEKLIVDPFDGEHWYLVGIADRRRAVFVTRDGGRSWSPVAVPAVSGSESSIQDFFQDVREPRRVVAEIQVRFVPGYRYFFSSDGGATWSPREAPQHSGPLLGMQDGIGWTRDYRVDFGSGVWTPHFEAGEFPQHQLRNATAMVFDRLRRDTFFIQTEREISVTKDGGATFSQPATGNLDSFAQSPLNPSHVAWGRGFLNLSLDRGTNWVRQENLPFVHQTAFDPASGEVVYSSFDAIHRRRLDGSLAPELPTNGLSVFDLSEVAITGGEDLMIDYPSRVYARDEEGSWRLRGEATATPAGGSGPESCIGPSAVLVSPSDPRKILMACSLSRFTFASGDGGRSWTAGAATAGYGEDTYEYVPQLSLARVGGAEIVYLLRRDQRFGGPPGRSVFRSADFGATWENLGTGFLEMIVHPDAARGVLAVRADGKLMHYLPGGGWQPVATAASETFLPVDRYLIEDLGFGYDPAHPELVYSIHHGSTYRSLDFGRSWERVATLSEAFESGGISEGFLYWIPRIVVDPFDAGHFLIPGRGIATRDGGRTFQFAGEANHLAATFDPATPGRFLTGSRTAGVLEITSSLPPCPTTPAAWCAGGGRFLLTVDWKDPQGNTGKATKVATGSEDSGLFYFFDQSNWELLVKVLDGCGLNDRFWVLAAGTTDVEYVMKVEDRWTGQIRHYANAAGRAAPAVIDTDAFSGCATAPPPGAAVAPLASAETLTGGETMLPLGGRFEARARWTDFTGGQGDALTAPLRSDNSGLFYFFSPNNWEVLVKVLDGCAINDHYWVLAAATTDVGYRLEIRDTESARTKVYTNPPGQAAPAQIDLRAFSCGQSR